MKNINYKVVRIWTEMPFTELPFDPQKIRKCNISAMSWRRKGSGGISWPLNGVEWLASAPAVVSQRKGPTWSVCLGEKKNFPCLEWICGSLVTVPIELLTTYCRRIWSRRVQIMGLDRYPCGPQSLNITPYETRSPEGNLWCTKLY